MSGSGSRPHDAVFRRVLGEPANAASQLRAVLPAALVERLDLDRLRQLPGGFVDETLEWRHTDLLFAAPLDGREAFVYVLIEHQSSTDPMMPFRMLHYVVRIWDQYLHDHAGRTPRLPVVIPLVVHHNRRRWTGPTELAEMLDLDRVTTGAVGEYLPRFRFLLDDLAAVDAPALRTRPVTPPVRMTLLLLKIAAGNRQLAHDLASWADELREVLDHPRGSEYFRTLLTYIETVGEAPADELHKLFAQLGTDAEEAYVTTAEMLRAEGEERGEARGRAEALGQILTLKFGPLPQRTLDVVNDASSDQLQTWTARAITAETLDDVMR